MIWLSTQWHVKYCQCHVLQATTLHLQNTIYIYIYYIYYSVEFCNTNTLDHNWIASSGMMPWWNLKRYWIELIICIYCTVCECLGIALGSYKTIIDVFRLVYWYILNYYSQTQRQYIITGGSKQFTGLDLKPVRSSRQTYKLYISIMIWFSFCVAP